MSTDQSKSEVIATKAPIRDLSAHQICSRCIYDGDVPKITFDEEGVCNYCRLAEQLEQEYGTGSEKGERLFADIVQEIKGAGKGKDAAPGSSPMIFAPMLSVATGSSPAKSACFEHGAKLGHHAPSPPVEFLIPSRIARWTGRAAFRSQMDSGRYVHSAAAFVG